jgi:hypothetical protein
VAIKRSADVIAKRSNLRKVFLGRKRYFDNGRDDAMDNEEASSSLNSVLAGFDGRHRKRPRPFLGKRADLTQISPSWLPADEDEQDVQLAAEEIGKRPHSKPFLGKRMIDE